VVQLPQKSSLDRVSTHIVPHIMFGSAQSGRHMPPMQEAPSPQTLVHVPQRWSVFSGMHALVGPPQRPWPSGQPQTPATHITPLGHLMPHVPQFASSVCVSVHVPPHMSSIGAVQTGRHMPPMHVVPLPHIVVQVPQFWLVFSGVHALFSPPHCMLPLGQRQSPASHVAPSGHGMPHPPQLFSSVCVLTHVVPHMLGV